ncbi:hypothetical protein AwPolaro_05890 [Polaromonas sp.]|nr:hypothetical protein AwPolaro_05890 [Polaromonas sp.]
MAPTLVASRTALPPGGTLCLRPGKAEGFVPPRLSLRVLCCPPEGALCLRPGEAGSAAPAWEEGLSVVPHLFFYV